MSKNWNYNKKVGLVKDNSLGNTNTPLDIAQQIVEKMVNLESVNKDSTFLEPCVGTGSFYFAMVNHLVKKFPLNHVLEKMVYAYEVDPKALVILKSKIKEHYPEANIKKVKLFEGNFIVAKVDQKFDYVITNPPYVSSSKMKPEGFKSRELMISAYIKGVDSKISKKSDLYIYFFIKTLNLLKENGKQIFLCSDSWLDTNFGQVLKDYLAKDYNLDQLISHRLFSLFRDDTSPITTIISKTKNKKTDVYQLDSKEFVFTEKDKTLSLSKKEFLEKINDDAVNKRNLFVLFGKEYVKGDSFYKENKSSLTKLENLVSIDSSSTTFNDLKKIEGAILTNKEEDKIFFQIQARINKPPNYKNNILTGELLYSIDREVAKDLLDFKKDNVYLSTIIDRYPLLFYVKDKETLHVSKYLSLKFKDDKCKIELLPIVINNLVSMYMVEIYLKEGTRKTLRIGEMGFGKELRKSEITNLPVVDIRKLSEDAVTKILEHQLNLENLVLYNIEEACNNPDYMAIQTIIVEDLKFNISVEDLKEVVLKLYHRRMRNIKKILGT